MRPWATWANKRSGPGLQLIVGTRPLEDPQADDYAHTFSSRYSISIDSSNYDLQTQLFPNARVMKFLELLPVMTNLWNSHHHPHRLLWVRHWQFGDDLLNNKKEEWGQHKMFPQKNKAKKLIVLMIENTASKNNRTWNRVTRCYTTQHKMAHW